MRLDVFSKSPNAGSPARDKHVLSKLCSVVVLDFHHRSEYEHNCGLFSTLQSHAPQLVPERPGPGN